MRQWGKKITVEEARKIIPNYEGKVRLAVEAFNKRRAQYLKQQQNDMADMVSVIRERTLKNLTDLELLEELERRAKKRVNGTN